MSGCVNCVWDEYRERVEGWVASRAKSRAAARKGGMEGVGVKGRAGVGVEAGAGESGVGDMDGGGGIGETGGMDEDGDGDVFADVPVGIREFMRTEKRLRERRRAGRGEG